MSKVNSITSHSFGESKKGCLNVVHPFDDNELARSFQDRQFQRFVCVEYATTNGAGIESPVVGDDQRAYD